MRHSGQNSILRTLAKHTSDLSRGMSIKNHATYAYSCSWREIVPTCCWGASRARACRCSVLKRDTSMDIMRCRACCSEIDPDELPARPAMEVASPPELPSLPCSGAEPGSTSLPPLLWPAPWEEALWLILPLASPRSPPMPPCGCCCCCC